MQVLQEQVSNFYIWQWLLLIIILIPACIWDIKEKSVSILVTGAGILAGLAINVLLEIDKVPKLFLCIIPGVFLLVCAWITEEAIGYGDGLVMLAIGNIVGLANSAKILFFALLIASFYSAGLMIVKKVGKKTVVPFVPFLLIGVLSIGIL